MKPPRHITVKRNFSDTTKKNAIVRNLQVNAGEFRCEICNLLLNPSEERFHFDHIEPYAKGGRPTLANCQVLCKKCNLKKSDRELEIFLFEQKAIRLMEEASNIHSNHGKNATKEISTKESELRRQKKESFLEEPILNQEKIDHISVKQILAFVADHGGIKKADLNRRGNQLPTITYVNKKWGGIIPMKEALGIHTGLQKWTRDNVKKALNHWIKQYGELRQTDLTQKNRLPSLPCILRYLPELNNFTEIKEYFGLERSHETWTKEKAILAGEKFIATHGPCLRQYHLNKANGLPSTKTLDRLFGGLRNYQKRVGSSVYDRNKKKTRADINAAIDKLFDQKDRVVKNKSHFYKKFPFSERAVSRLYGSTDQLFLEYSILETNPKRASFSKEDIDKLIKAFVKKHGGNVPKDRELKGFGLPSKDSIEKFYQNYRQPFIYFFRLYLKSQ